MTLCVGRLLEVCNNPLLFDILYICFVWGVTSIQHPTQNFSQKTISIFIYGDFCFWSTVFHVDRFQPVGMILAVWACTSLSKFTSTELNFFCWHPNSTGQNIWLNSSNVVVWSSEMWQHVNAHLVHYVMKEGVAFLVWFRFSLKH